MQVVSEEISASRSAVPVIDAEEGTLGPFFVRPVRWLENVQDDRDSIFVVASDDALVGIGRICYDYSVPLNGALLRLVVGDNDLMGWLERHLR